MLSRAALSISPVSLQAERERERKALYEERAIESGRKRRMRRERERNKKEVVSSFNVFFSFYEEESASHFFRRKKAKEQEQEKTLLSSVFFLQGTRRFSSLFSLSVQRLEQQCAEDTTASRTKQERSPPLLLHSSSFCRRHRRRATTSLSATLFAPPSPLRQAFSCTSTPRNVSADALGRSCMRLRGSKVAIALRRRNNSLKTFNSFFFFLSFSLIFPHSESHNSPHEMHH